MAVACVLALRDPIDFALKKDKRESVVDMIDDGRTTVQPNGVVELHDELKSLSDSGKCIIVEFRGQTAVCFFAFRGLLESSKGFLYITDKISYKDYIDTSKYVPNTTFINVLELAPNWYSCSTD